MIRRPLLLFALMAVGSLNLFATNQLITNGGFETGSMAPWTIGQDFCPGFSGTPCNPWHVVSTGAHSGTYALEDQGATEVVQSITPTSGALITDASFWFKQDDPTFGFTVELYYSDNSGSSMDVFPIFPSNSNWNMYDITSDIESGKTLVQIGFAGYSGFGPGTNLPNYLDDVSIKALPTLNPIPSPEPASLLLLASGLLGLTALRKR